MARIPSLTAKSLVDFSRKSPSAKKSLLRKQKFPGEGVTKIQMQYYGTVSTAIRHYFLQGKHDASAIRAAKNKAKSSKQLSRRKNLIRALRAFGVSSLKRGHLYTARNSHHFAALRGMHLRANPEMTATENGKRVHFFFHFGAKPMDPGQAQQLANVIHWVLRQEDAKIQADSVEVWDIQANRVIRARDVMPETARFIDETMAEASKLWPDLAATRH